MKKIVLILFLMFVVIENDLMARDVQLFGKKIGVDQQGNDIYQVHANGIEIGYKIIGSGEPLVMLMGIGSTMERWPVPLIESLSRKYQLILMDNRGMGYSTANDVPFTFKLFASDVVALLDALQIKKTHVLGLSMGSVITQELLLEFSQRVNKAIVHATCIDEDRVVEQIERALPNDPIVQRQLKTHWKTPLDKLPSITNQVMLIVGTADTVVGTESSKIIASAIPGAWLVQFKNGTHHLIGEAPDEFSRIVIDFLDINETVGIK